MSEELSVVIACGGTGGHLFPGIAVAEELKRRGHQPLLFISQKKVDADASAKYGALEFATVAAIAKPPSVSTSTKLRRLNSRVMSCWSVQEPLIVQSY